MAKILIFRHAQTAYNRDGIFCGKIDADITEEGIKEAEGVREKLKNEKITKAYTSNQLRAMHTMEIVLQGHVPKVKIVKDARLRERDYGDLTGKKKKELEKQFPKEYPLWHRSYDVPPPNGESIKMVSERVDNFLDEVVIPNIKPDDVILFCCSSNSMRPLMRRFGHLTTEEMCTVEHIRGDVHEYQYP